MTNKALITFCKQQARLKFEDYGDKTSYRRDRNRILYAKKRAIKAAGLYWDVDALVRPGEYYGGRLIVTTKGVEYIAGQYAPTEIYFALENYFEQFLNAVNESDGVDWKREFEINYER